MTTVRYNVELSQANDWGVKIGPNEFVVVRETLNTKGKPALVVLVNGIERTLLRSHTSIDATPCKPIEFAEPVDLATAFTRSRGVIDATLLRR